MIRYTTPALPLEIEGIDLTQQQDVYVSIKGGDTYLEKTGSDLDISVDTQGQIDITTIIVALTQEETASFKEGLQSKVQVNWINESGVRDATDIVSVDIQANLLQRVLTYGD